MGKRGRPSKKKPNGNTTTKVDQCYAILSSDEEVVNKKETLRLPSPSQRRGVGNERNNTIIITPPDRSTALTNNIEKKTPLTRNNLNNNDNKKKIILMKMLFLKMIYINKYFSHLAMPKIYVFS